VSRTVRTDKRSIAACATVARIAPSVERIVTHMTTVIALGISFRFAAKIDIFTLAAAP